MNLQLQPAMAGVWYGFNGMGPALPNETFPQFLARIPDGQKMIFPWTPHVIHTKLTVNGQPTFQSTYSAVPVPFQTVLSS